MTEQETFFEKPEPAKINPELKKRVRQKREVIPPEYIPVRFSSMGRLKAPAVLHFRNFTMENVLLLSSATDSYQIKALINVLNDMVYGDFDCGLLHDKELQIVLMTLHMSFWGNVLENVPYVINPDKKISKNNIGKIHVDLRDIKDKAIDTEFKEPFGITYNSKTVYFNFKKIVNDAIAIDYIEKKYTDKEIYFSSFKRDLEKIEEVEKYNSLVTKQNEQLIIKSAETGNQFPLKPMKEVPIIDIKKMQEYEKYMEEKTIDLLRVTQALLIDDRSADTLEKKLELTKNLGLQYWNKYEHIRSKYEVFGPDNDFEVKKDSEGKPVVRRLQFRFTDFVPSVGHANDDSCEVSFG